MKRFFALLLALVMLLSLAACGQNNDDASNQTDPQPSSDAQPEPTAAEVYTEAAGKVQAMTDAWLTVRMEKQTDVGGQSFVESQDLNLKMNGIGTDSLAADLSGTIDFGEEYSVVLYETFKDGTLYGEIANLQYSAEVTAEDFAARYVPAVLLDASLYSNVAFTDDTTLSFSGPSGLESWVGEDCELIGAVGTAVLNETGALTSTTYDVTYSRGSAVITEIVTVEVKDFTAQVEAPANTSGYVLLDHPDIPLILERSYGNLLQSRSLSSTIQEMIISAGVNALYSISHEVDLYGAGLDAKLQIDSTHAMTDLAGTPIWTTLVNERYTDGNYDYTVDGQKQTSAVDSADAAEELRLSFLEFASESNATYFEEMETVTLTEVPGGYVLDFTFNDTKNGYLKDYACQRILNDPGLLDSLADSYTVQQAEGYMGIDAVTCLPTSYSISYTGSHSIDGMDYVLSLQSTQSIDAASLGAYTAVTGEPMPVEEQMESPKPLFYHVTGSNGEEMWLLGTIHVGDQRTTDLPVEIYKAFRASDALAVEFDLNAFDEQMENDPAFAQALAAYLVYTDGTGISSHIEDAEVYEAAKQMLKFSGEYSATVEMMKPAIWSQSIDNFYLRLGHKLTSDYGVDMQLLNMAEAQEKKILNVESGMAQMQMFAGYSDALQEYLLASSLSYTPAEYNADVNEMFELWCAGDEAALIEMLAPADTSEMSAEELALYEEYTKAMEWDRNVQMLDVAKGYLSSGDTVFYAVGLAHLLAEDGLVNTLRAAGYTVELVSYA